MAKMSDEKIPNVRPTTLQYILRVLRYMFSPTFLKQLFYLAAYYSLNHVKGRTKAHIGKGVWMWPTVLLRDAERIYIGDGSEINHNNILWAGRKHATIRIGRNVMTGPNVSIIAFRHGMELGEPMVRQPGTEDDIVIGDDVWLGVGVTVLPGVIIGDGVIVGAGSVVTKDLPPYTICAGVPAKVIRTRQQSVSCVAASKSA